jgi:hypothetical protein
MCVCSLPRNIWLTDSLACTSYFQAVTSGISFRANVTRGHVYHLVHLYPMSELRIKHIAVLKLHNYNFTYAYDFKNSIVLRQRMDAF